MPRLVDPSIASRLHARVEMLARFSEESDQLTRPFLSGAMREASAAFAGWCRDAGLDATIDKVGNVRARWRADRGGPEISGEQRPFLALGSHLDTVRNAGRYDGALGALMALACVEHARASGMTLPFDLEVVGFSDEEGLRYQTAYLGSSYYAGVFSGKWLERVDRDGHSLARALKAFGSDPMEVVMRQARPSGLVGYLEVHIEQGPILEKSARAVGVVSAIAAQARAGVRFIGKAGHAGTTPMDSRQDALCAAAELILALEKLGRDAPPLRATVGQARAEPGASNVIPSEVWISVDMRHPNDDALARALAQARAETEEIARRRGLSERWLMVQETPAVPMNGAFQAALMRAARANAIDDGARVRRERSETDEGVVPSLVSGAGHDAVMLSRVCPVGMLFVRCREGLSHHPDEYAAPEDIEIALDVLASAVKNLGQRFPFL